MIIYIVLLIVLLVLFFGPQIWVKRVLNQYRTHRGDLPGTVGELARHLLQRYDIQDVNVDVAEEGKDHYDIQAKT